MECNLLKSLGSMNTNSVDISFKFLRYFLFWYYSSDPGPYHVSPCVTNEDNLIHCANFTIEESDLLQIVEGMYFAPS